MQNLYEMTFSKVLDKYNMSNLRCGYFVARLS